MKYKQLMTAGAVLLLAISVGWQFRSQASQIADDTRYVYNVTVDGKVVAQVVDPNAVEITIEEIKADATNEVNRPPGHLKIDQEVAFTPVEASAAGPITPLKELQEYLRENLTFSVKPTSIVIDGQPVVTVANQEVAEEVIAQIEEKYLQQLTDEKVVAVEEVSVVQKIEYHPVDAGKVASAQEAEQLLERGTDKEVLYTVVPGDSLWTIARDHGMTVEDIRTANPELKGDLLHEGDTLNLTVPRPYITFRSKEIWERTESVPYETEVRKDDSLYTWQKVVQREGKPGQRRVKLNVVRVNGIVVDESIISEEILSEPQSALVVQGTRQAATVASTGGGKLGWPLSGQLTSHFGQRSSGFHSGLDIAAPWGSPVYAAESGQVVFAGWSGGYGNLIRIVHGGDVVTFYGHLSKISVSVGQQVRRGQLVGHVGSTGNSTGSHLHFEVRINGDPQNPMRYLQ